MPNGGMDGGGIFSFFSADRSQITSIGEMICSSAKRRRVVVPGKFRLLSSVDVCE